MNTDSELYLSKIKKIKYLSGPHKVIKYRDLRQINRCELFTELRRNVGLKIGSSFMQEQTSRDVQDPFCFLVLEMGQYNIVITHLAQDIYFPHGRRESIPFSANVTMSELLQTKGVREVHCTIDWNINHFSESMDTSAGKMYLLQWPVLLRVQTEFDKNYGNGWGYYGDTTDFLMLGILERRNDYLLVPPR